MFVMANLARHLRIDPEAALRAANAKFTRRFHAIEAALAARGPRPGRLDARRDGRALGRREGAERAAMKQVDPCSLPSASRRPRYTRRRCRSRSRRAGSASGGRIPGRSAPTARAAPGAGASLQSVAPPAIG